MLASQTTSVSKHELTFLAFSVFFGRIIRKIPVQLQNIPPHSQGNVCAVIYQFIKIQILWIKCIKQKSNHKHENTSDLFCLPCLPVHGTLHANRMQMPLIESGDAEVIVFGEMSKTLFFPSSVGGFLYEIHLKQKLSSLHNRVIFFCHMRMWMRL